MDTESSLSEYEVAELLNIDATTLRGRSPDWVAAELDGHDYCILFESSPDEKRTPHALLAKLRKALGRRYKSVALAYLLPDADGSKPSFAEFRAHGGSVSGVRALRASNPDRVETV